MLASPRDQSKVSHWLWEKKKLKTSSFTTLIILVSFYTQFVKF